MSAPYDIRDAKTDIESIRKNPIGGYGSYSIDRQLDRLTLYIEGLVKRLLLAETRQNEHTEELFWNENIETRCDR